MRFTLVAVAAGFVLALVSGGRPRYLADKPVAGWPLLVVGLGLQASVNRLADTLGLAALIASYAVLLLFGLVNLRLVGMPLVLVGLALNAFTITLNGGMSVRPSAVLAARAAPADKLAHLHIVGKHHLARPSDRLTILSDVIPVRPLHEVLSFGDIIMSVGVADVLANLLRPAREAPAGEASPARQVQGSGRARTGPQGHPGRDGPGPGARGTGDAGADGPGTGDPGTPGGDPSGPGTGGGTAGDRGTSEAGTSQPGGRRSRVSRAGRWKRGA